MITRIDRGVRPAVWVAAGAAAGVLAASLLPALADAATSGQSTLWWASRASGFVAYLALALSMLFGVFVTARGLDGLVRRRVVLELHQQWALAAVIATALHVLTVVANAHAGVGVAGTLVPFAAARLTGAVALGVVGAWALAIIALSSWLRRRLPYTAWRAVHGLAFGVFALALVHSIAAGTDSGHPVVQWWYLGTSAVVGGATLFRALVAIGSRGRRARTHAIERHDAHLAA